MKNKSRYFDNSNLSLVGVSRDSNGNKVIKVQFGDERAFSIQTLNNLRKTHGMVVVNKSIHDLSDSQLNTIEKECVNYIQIYGSKNQQESLVVYSEDGLSGTPKNNVLHTADFKNNSDFVYRINGYSIYWKHKDAQRDDYRFVLVVGGSQYGTPSQDLLGAVSEAISLPNPISGKYGNSELTKDQKQRLRVALKEWDSQSSIKDLDSYGLSGTPKNKPKEQKEAKLTKELADKIHAKILKVEPSSLSKLRDLVDKYNVFYQVEQVQRLGFKKGVRVCFTQNSKTLTRPLKDKVYDITDWD